MEITEEEFDKLVKHTLRIELLNGMVLIYRVGTAEKQRLIGQLRNHSEGGELYKALQFLYFQTSLQRNVMISAADIVRVIFCYDAVEEVIDPNAYYDNFKVLEKDTNLVEESTPEGKVALLVVTEEFLPSAIIFHKGEAADDGYDSNPLLYYDLEPGCLDTFNLELDDYHLPVRQFINLMDMDGEANFIALSHVTVMEFEDALLYSVEESIGEDVDDYNATDASENILDDGPVDSNNTKTDSPITD